MKHPGTDLGDATGKADLHTHTSFTDGMMDVRSLLDHFQEHTNVDVVCLAERKDSPTVRSFFSIAESLVGETRRSATTRR